MVHPSDPAALDALLAVTAPLSADIRPADALTVHLGRVADAACADRGLLWAPAGSEFERPALCLHTARCTDVVAVLEPLELPASEQVVSVTDDHPFARVLTGLGVRHGLLLPIAVGEPIGALCVLGSTDGAEPTDDPVRRHAVRVGARAIGGLLERRQLRDDLERAMAQILVTDERMLGRMGLDIHDGPTQQLSVALLEVQLLDAELGDADDAGLPSPASLRPALSRIYETVGGALHEMRELIGHLRPAQFEDRRLIDILQDAITAFEARADSRVDLAWDGEFPVNGVSISQRITLYRILQETLTNAHRHGRARHLTVHVSEDHAGVTLEVCDDGIGFDVDAAQRRRPGMPLARFGLHGMRDRARILGGSLSITSTPGSGTTVRVFLPRWVAGRGARPPAS